MVVASVVSMQFTSRRLSTVNYMTCALILFSPLPGARSASACGRTSDQRTFTLQGQVLSLEPARKKLDGQARRDQGLHAGDDDAVRGARTRRLLDGLAPGDLINATLVVVSNGAYLTTIKKVGAAPLEKPPAEAPSPPASSGFELLKPGEAVPDDAFVDQDGRKRRFSDFKGSPVVMTFIYTQCPIADLLPADGSAFRGAPEVAEGRTRR